MTKKNIQPASAVIAVTYRCNSRCRMCNIWQKEPSEEVSPLIYRKLPTSLDDINLTGGEPFLRPDLPAIIDIVMARCRPIKLVISSNGFLTEQIIAAAERISKRPDAGKISLSFSLDGLGKLHGEIRGVANAYDKVMATVNGLIAINFPRRNLGLGYTFMAGNETEYKKVYGLSQKMGINFGATIAHNSDNYFSTQINQPADALLVERQIDFTIKEKISSLAKNELGKCYYFHGLARFALTGQRILSCQAANDSFFLDPKGDVYPCNILSGAMGNLIKNDFAQIWNSPEAEKLRRLAKNCPTPCWMVCTAKPAIKRHWLKAGLWLIKRKLKNKKQWPKN